ncbi:sugar efflux transporter [Virgisporangium ochraceum]|nr:sugar efflux transporter [Virgisporangium ochraceum]
MSPTTTAPARTGRQIMLPLGLVFLTSGLSVALVVPFMTLFLDTEVDAGPVRTTVFLVASPVAGVAVAWAIGRVSDRWPVRRQLLIVASVAGVVSTASTAVVRDYWVLLTVAVTAWAVAGSLFPQTFAFARQVLDRGDPKRAALGISALRTVFSVAFVAGPPLAAVLLAAGGFHLVFGAAAVMYAVAAVVALFLLPDVGAPPAPPPADRPGGATAARLVIVLTIAGFVLLQTPLVLGGQTLSLFVATDLGGTVTDAGLLFGLCAALEIPLMLGLGVLSTRMPVRTLILVGAVAGIAYHALAASAHAVWVLVAGQVLNALYISAISALGIPYVQDLMPGRPGHATTMIANTFPMGQILAGPLFGLAQSTGYRLAYVLSFALSVGGLLFLLVARPPSSRRSGTPHPGTSRSR